MKNRNFIFIVLIAGTLVLGSCEDWLEEKPLTFLSSSNFYQNKEEVTSAVYSLYGALNPLYQNLAYAEVAWSMWELPGDETYANSGRGGISQVQIDQYDFDEDLNHFRLWWQHSYVLINRANTIINNIDNNENISSDVRSIAMAEARFMRGLSYFNLAVAYGDVPLIIKELDETFPSRSPVSEVYAQAIADLQFAEDNLPESWEGIEYGRATKYAAKSYLAKLYITMAGYPVQDASKMALAASKAKEVIDNGPYELYDNVLDNWNPDVSPKEQIFVLNRVRGVLGGWGAYWAPLNQGVLAAEVGVDFLGAMIPNPEFYDWYPDTDPRKDMFFMSEVTSYQDPSVVVTLPFPSVAKYWGPIYANGTDQDIVLLRYADILLIYAEAENEINGATSSAYQALNRVRERAFGNNSGNLSGLSKEDFRKAVREERSLELCFEGNSWPDMLRTRESRAGSIFDYENIGGVSPSEKNLLFPIPSSEINANPNLVQNLGYQ